MRPTIRYYPITYMSELSAIRELGPDEAYVTMNFEIAEALISRGVDSARIAISQLNTSDEHYPGYVQAAPNKQANKQAIKRRRWRTPAVPRLSIIWRDGQRHDP